MAIDDLASERGLKQLEMEDLGNAPELAKALPSIALQAMKALLSGESIDPTGLFEKFHQNGEEQRSKYLYSCIVEDLKWFKGRMDNLSAQLENYLETDFVGLLMDADKKARETRAKGRIKRIADVLSASLRIEPTPPADETEELMRIATELSDIEVRVLEGCRQTLEHFLRNQGTSVFSLQLPRIDNLSGEEVLGICSKLQSFGLLAEPQKHALARGGASYPTGSGFMLLPRAERFLKFIAEANKAS